MNEYDFKTSIEKPAKFAFSKKLNILIKFSIAFTGIFVFVGFVALCMMIGWFLMGELGTTGLFWNLLLYLVNLLCFIALIELNHRKRPFSKTLTYSIWGIGALFVISSFLFPRLPDFQGCTFELLAHGDFVLINGALLYPGLLLIILGSLIKAGFELQKETDETI